MRVTAKTTPRFILSESGNPHLLTSTPDSLRVEAAVAFPGDAKPIERAGHFREDFGNQLHRQIWVVNVARKERMDENLIAEKRWGVQDVRDELNVT